MNSPEQIIETIQQRIPRYPLAQFPTPLHSGKASPFLPNSPKIWFKRDDLISFAFGGNKVRGLEILAADIVQQKATDLVTGAGIQSNHVRATAFTAAQLGLQLHSVYWGSPPETCEGNYRLTRMLGSQIHFTNDTDRASVDFHIDRLCENLAAQGRKPYSIPRGGACVLGVLGHVLAVFEVYQQAKKHDLEIDAVAFAVGSGGTYAGWLLGCRLLNLPWRLLAYTVSRTAEEASQQVANLATAAARKLDLDWIFTAKQATVMDGFIGAGYGIPSPQGQKAIVETAKTQGLLLDPTYTGKAMAGLLHSIASGELADCKNLLFIHTGGEPAFFSGNCVGLCPEEGEKSSCA